MPLSCIDPSSSDEEPPLRPWSKKDRLTPAPPPGWLLVTRLGSNPIPRSIAAWVYLVATIQQCDGSHVFIARDPFGARCLLCAPHNAIPVKDALEQIYSSLHDCSCGGYDCLNPEVQRSSEIVLARRRWAGMSLSERIDWSIENADAEPEGQMTCALADFGEIEKLGGWNLSNLAEQQ